MLQATSAARHNRLRQLRSHLISADASAALAYDPPVPKTIDDLRTPCLVLQLDVAQQNIDRMQARAEGLGCVVRPHVKTHKTLELGALQTQGTKRRITCSTLAEARFFAAGGFDDILYAVPITPDKLPEAAALTVALEAFHILIDNAIQLDAILTLPAPGPNTPWSVFIMVDCGYGRDGVDPSDPTSLDIAERLATASTTTLSGVYTHGGHSYDSDETGSAVSSTAVVDVGAMERDGEDTSSSHHNWISGEISERLLVVAVTVEFARQLREERGVECPIVGVGSTPTCSNPPPHLDGVDEMHPGNYIFNDTSNASKKQSPHRSLVSRYVSDISLVITAQSMLGSCTSSDVAVRVLTRVIGHYPRKNMLLIDLGWTGCSAQGAEFGYGILEGHPELKVVQLKQEAGEVEAAEHSTPLDFSLYPIGSILELLPYHSCAAVKMHEKMHVLEEDRRTIKGAYEICRGW